MAYGGGKDTFYNPNGQDTILGGQGNDNTLMFQGDGTFNLSNGTDMTYPAIDVGADPGPLGPQPISGGQLHHAVRKQ